MIKLKNILSEMEQLRMANPNQSSLPRPKNRDEWNIDDWTNYWEELRYKKPKKPRKPRKINKVKKPEQFLSYPVDYKVPFSVKWKNTKLALKIALKNFLSGK